MYVLLYVCMYVYATICISVVICHRALSFDFSQDLRLDPASSPVYFGQLLGMSDHLTYLLGAQGFKAYKYVPYGKVGEVMPYLIRRAKENSTVLGGPADKEISLIWQELWRRCRSTMSIL